jgi:F-type H+-transporting ATPase subunit a
LADPTRVDPIHQFGITNVFSFGGEGAFALTNSGLFMVISVVVILGYLLLSTAGRRLVPTRAQVVSEMLY